MKINVVTKDYFKNALQTNKYKLERSKKMNDHFKTIQTVFSEFVTGERDIPRVNVSTEEMIKNLSDKMNKELETIKLQTWKKIQLMCWRLRKYRALDCVYANKSLSNEEIVEGTLKLYRDVDREFYLAARTLLEDRKTHLYFNDLGVNTFYNCADLNYKFIACSLVGYNTYPSFAHEVQHGIDFELFPDTFLLYDELDPMFFEILMCDKLNKDNLYPGIYGERIDEHNLLMESIFDYVKILDKFDRKGRNLTLQNICWIFEIESEENLKEIYDQYYYDELLDSLTYVISFMQAIEIRELYYNSKKDGIMQLKNKLTGVDCRLNYESLINSYENFINEIDKCKVKSYDKKI